MRSKPRVLVVQPNMQPGGGAGCVSAWAVQALQTDFALDLWTWIPFDADPINRFYGTALDSAHIRNFHPPAWLRALFALDRDPFSFQSFALMMRVAKMRRRQYDLVVSLCDEVDFGAPAVQYVHYPYFGPLYQRELTSRDRSSRRRPWRLLSGFDFERMRRNYTLVNSDWTGTRFRCAYDAPTQTLYPPVHGDVHTVPWAERADGFVCIGRVHQQKRYLEIIAILQALRARGHNLQLNIIAARQEVAHEEAYYNMLLSLIRENSGWIQLHENISRVELARLVSQYRYGIHAMRAEHFGIGPAELVRGGCITFVFDEGGPVEIVGAEPRLRYTSNEDAVEKIERVLNDNAAQTELRAALEQRAALFTPQVFMEGFRAHIARFMA